MRENIQKAGAHEDVFGKQKSSVNTQAACLPLLY
jgi:hypothetical protein